VCSGKAVGQYGSSSFHCLLCGTGLCNWLFARFFVCGVVGVQHPTSEGLRFGVGWVIIWTECFRIVCVCVCVCVSKLFHSSSACLYCQGQWLDHPSPTIGVGMMSLAPQQMCPTGKFSILVQCYYQFCTKIIDFVWSPRYYSCNNFLLDTKFVCGDIMPYCLVNGIRRLDVNLEEYFVLFNLMLLSIAIV
jgi:hypothetical protein